MSWTCILSPFLSEKPFRATPIFLEEVRKRCSTFVFFYDRNGDRTKEFFLSMCSLRGVMPDVFSEPREVSPSCAEMDIEGGGVVRAYAVKSGRSRTIADIVDGEAREVLRSAEVLFLPDYSCLDEQTRLAVPALKWEVLRFVNDVFPKAGDCNAPPQEGLFDAETDDHHARFLKTIHARTVIWVFPEDGTDSDPDELDFRWSDGSAEQTDAAAGSDWDSGDETDDESWSM